MSESFNTPEATPKVSSEIELRFFRHDEKEKDPQKNDYNIELTPKGRIHAMDQSTNDDISQSVAFGSPRRRTQETAGFVMAGATDEISGTETFSELKAKVDNNVGYGSKINTDSRLNFEFEGDTEYVKAAIKAYEKGELMTFLVEESDRMASETGDTLSSTYSNMASSIAKIIKKYVGIAPRWDELVKDETKEYNPVMKRFFGTHQTVQESFLAKVIDKVEGKEARDKFLEVLKKKGFDYSEGFEVEIVTKEGSVEPMVKITYKKDGKTPEEGFVFSQEVSIDVIDEISK